MIITGIRLHRAALRICFRTSMPEIRGRFRSSSTSPGHRAFSSRKSFSRNANASEPSWAIRRRKARPHCSRTSVITKRSVSLSSTSKTVTGCRVAYDVELAPPSFSGLAREGKAEGGSFARDRVLHPDAAPILLHQTLADCQSNTGSGILLPAM